MIKLLIIILIVIVLSLSCVKVIKQSKVGIVMRLGKFQKKADTGVHFLIPFLDQMAYVIDLRENVVDFPPQPVITKDNVTMQIDTVVYFQVTDPVRYVFEIANPISAIENLTATTLRNIIGELDLDETLTSRDIINTKMRSILDEATDIKTVVMSISFFIRCSFFCPFSCKNMLKRFKKPIKENLIASACYGCRL